MYNYHMLSSVRVNRHPTSDGSGAEFKNRHPIGERQARAGLDRQRMLCAIKLLISHCIERHHAGITNLELLLFSLTGKRIPFPKATRIELLPHEREELKEFCEQQSLIIFCNFLKKAKDNKWISFSEPEFTSDSEGKITFFQHIFNENTLEELFNEARNSCEALSVLHKVQDILFPGKCARHNFTNAIGFIYSEASFLSKNSKSDLPTG